MAITLAADDERVRVVGQAAVPLAAGWNLVSVPIVPASTAIADFLASVDGLYTIFHAWDAAAQAWKSYDPTLPPKPTA